MALLRNRPVQILGPTGDTASPIYTVQYSDGTRENVELKFIHMNEAEHKQWAKANPSLADHVKVIDDKEHQEIVDSQDRTKIEQKEKKGELNKNDKPVPVTPLVRPSDVKGK